MPPEVFENKGYDFSFDVWSFGCVLYEIVVGEPPFGSADGIGYDEMSDVLHGQEITMKEYFSNDFKSLLNGLLDRRPKKRLTI